MDRPPAPVALCADSLDKICTNSKVRVDICPRMARPLHGRMRWSGGLRR